MKSVTQIGAMLAAGMLVIQPCVANDFRDGQALQTQTSAFVGLNVRLPLGQAQKAKPTARLRFTTAQTTRDERTGTTQIFKPRGLEIGGMKGGKPTIYLNGQSMTELQKTHSIGGGDGTLLLVGGALIVVVLVLAASASARSDLLNPCSGDSTLCD